MNFSIVFQYVCNRISTKPHGVTFRKIVITFFTVFRNSVPFSPLLFYKHFQTVKTELHLHKLQDVRRFVDQLLYTAWFKKIDSISYVYTSWTVYGMWMIYITFERGGPKFSNTTARALAYHRAAASVESKMATMQHKIFCVREFIKTESATAVQSAFLLRFNVQPPTRKSICPWNHQFELTGCVCKGKSSGRPHVSEENVRRIQECFECSPRKSTRRASRELGIPQPTVWRVLRRRLLFKP